MSEIPRLTHTEDADNHGWVVGDPGLATREAPDFTRHLTRLEDMAEQGIVTPEGINSYEFRAGIEIEFQLADPKKLNAALSDRRITINTRNGYLESVVNKSDIGATIIDISNSEEEAHLRNKARDTIGALEPRNEAEAARKQEWLSQIPQFTTKDFINFRLYQEFSTPSLVDPVLGKNATLAEVDTFSQDQGWLEFRFGKGELQTGYYDNPGMSEVRLAPCAPHEAVRRKAVVLDRLGEIAGEYGVLAMESADTEHINLSIYEHQGDSVRPVIGNSTPEARRRTVDVTSGIAAGYQDGLWIHADTARFNYNFGRYASQQLKIGPTRQTMRVLEGRIELRSSFKQADQALGWLMAGSIAGLAKGADGLAAEGYTPTQEAAVYHVQRNASFNKQTDIHIQRAFEASEVTDGVFQLGDGWNMIRGGDLFTALTAIPENEQQSGADLFNKIAISSVRLDDRGIPQIDPNLLKAAIANVREYSRPSLEKQPKFDESMISHLNERLSTVTLKPTKVVKGVAAYGTASREDAFAKLQASPMARLAYGEDVDSVVQWLNSTPIRDALERLEDEE
jgi:hypothetical protein